MVGQLGFGNGWISAKVGQNTIQERLPSAFRGRSSFSKRYH